MMIQRRSRQTVWLFGLTEAYKQVLGETVNRPDLVEQVTQVDMRWATCPLHGDYTDGLVVRRGENNEPVHVASKENLNDPDMFAFGYAAYVLYEAIRAALSEPPLKGTPPEVLQHKHCSN